MHRGDRASRSCDGAAVMERGKLSRDDEVGAILPSYCRGGRSNRMFLWMPSKHCRKQTSQARRSEPNQTNQRAKVLPRENSLVILCSKLPMLQQEAESSRMSMLAKVSPRENSLVTPSVPLCQTAYPWEWPPAWLTTDWQAISGDFHSITI